MATEISYLMNIFWFITGGFLCGIEVLFFIIVCRIIYLTALDLLDTLNANNGLKLYEVMFNIFESIKDKPEWYKIRRAKELRYKCYILFFLMWALVMDLVFFSLSIVFFLNI